jgi:hypothetical protein
LVEFLTGLFRVIEIVLEIENLVPEGCTLRFGFIVAWGFGI